MWGWVVVEVTCSAAYLKKANFKLFLIKEGDIATWSHSNFIIFAITFSRFARLCLPILMRLILRNLGLCDLLLSTTGCDRISRNRVKNNQNVNKIAIKIFSNLKRRKLIICFRNVLVFTSQLLYLQHVGMSFENPI